MEELSGRWNSAEDDFLLDLKNAGFTYQEIADGMSEYFQKKFTSQSCRGRYRRIKENFDEMINEETSNPILEKEFFKDKSVLEINADGTQRSEKLIEMNEEESKDPAFILQAHGYNPKEWEVVSVRSSMWNQHNKVDKTITLYSSKITVKPISFENLAMQDLIKEMENYKRPESVFQYKELDTFSNKNKMLEVNIADLHLGKMCWSGDSNDTYNIEIAKERFNNTIDDIISKSKMFSNEIEKVIFIFSNDFFHYDTLAKTTTKGTPQDTDIQMQEMFKVGYKLLIDAIYKLGDISPVEVVYVGANHDNVLSYFVCEVLSSWFREDSNVKVDTDPKSRKYIEYGNSLIQFSHGHNEKKRLGSVMQHEMREAWGRTKFHEVHAGHIHSEKETTELNGVIIRHVSSTTGTDKWHYDSGFVGAVKKTQTFLWDKDKGLEMIFHSNING